jgi:hypothetical protein
VLKILKWGTIVIVLLAVGAGLSPSDKKGNIPSTQTADTSSAEPSSSTASDESTPEPTPEPRVREAIDASGDSELSCDYDLGDFGDSGDPAKGYRFLGGGTLTNTGNVGIVVRVTYKWRLLGQGSIVKRQTYRLRRNGSRDVDISFPVTDDMIDAHQSADGKCSSRATIVDHFGKPPYES